MFYLFNKKLAQFNKKSYQAISNNDCLKINKLKNLLVFKRSQMKLIFF